LPHFLAVYHPASAPSSSSSSHLTAVARAIGLRAIDLTTELVVYGRTDRVWNFPMSHYTPFGYDLVAHAIERELTRTVF
jgi:hypothetical protein